MSRVTRSIFALWSGHAKQQTILIDYVEFEREGTILALVFHRKRSYFREDKVIAKNLWVLMTDDQANTVAEEE